MKKKCSNCGHDCHCNKTDCADCINDVCTKCECDEKNKK